MINRSEGWAYGEDRQKTNDRKTPKDRTLRNVSPGEPRPLPERWGAALKMKKRESSQNKGYNKDRALIEPERVQNTVTTRKKVPGINEKGKKNVPKKGT